MAELHRVHKVDQSNDRLGDRRTECTWSRSDCGQ